MLIKTSYSMVLHLIRADILIVAEYLRATSKMYSRIIFKTIRIRDLLFHQEKILLFWFLFSSKSVEIHPALSVHPTVYQYMARANDVNNTAS